MKCKECKRWQGNKSSEWGDCYRVIGTLCPELLSQFTINEWGTMDKVFNLPFDPHDERYWRWHGKWMELYYDLIYTMLKTDVDGVKVVEDLREDIVYDYNRGERIVPIKLYYFMTRKDYNCDDYKEND